MLFFMSFTFGLLFIFGNRLLMDRISRSIYYLRFVFIFLFSKHILYPFWVIWSFLYFCILVIWIFQQMKGWFFFNASLIVNGLGIKRILMNLFQLFIRVICFTLKWAILFFFFIHRFQKRIGLRIYLLFTFLFV